MDLTDVELASSDLSSSASEASDASTFDAFEYQQEMEELKEEELQREENDNSPLRSPLKGSLAVSKHTLGGNAFNYSQGSLSERVEK